MYITHFRGQRIRSVGFDYSVGKLWGSLSFNRVYKKLTFRKPFEMRGLIAMGLGIRLAIYWGV